MAVGKIKFENEEDVWDVRQGRTAKDLDSNIVKAIETAYSNGKVATLSIATEDEGKALTNELRRTAKAMDVTVQVQYDVLEDGTLSYRFKVRDRIRKPRKAKNDEAAA